MEDPEADPGIDCAIRRNRNTYEQIKADETKVYSISLYGIKDGTSNVMLINEKQMNLANEPPVKDDDQGHCVGHDIDNMRTCAVPPQKDLWMPRRVPEVETESIASVHPMLA